MIFFWTIANISQHWALHHIACIPQIYVNYKKERRGWFADMLYHDFVNFISVRVVVLVGKQEWCSHIQDLFDFFFAEEISLNEMVSESLARYEPKDSTLNIMITGLSKVGINKNYLIYDKTQYIDYITITPYAIFYRNVIISGVWTLKS